MSPQHRRDAAARVRGIIHTADGPFSRDVALVLDEVNALDVIRRAADNLITAETDEVRDRASFTLAALLGQYEAGALPSTSQFAEHVRRIVDQAPALSQGQRDRIAALLRPVAVAPAERPERRRPGRLIRVRFGGPSSTRYLYSTRWPVAVGDRVETPDSLFGPGSIATVVQIDAQRDGFRGRLASIVRVVPS